MKSLKSISNNATKQEILPFNAQSAIKGGDGPTYSDPWEKRKRPTGYLMTGYPTTVELS